MFTVPTEGRSTGAAVIKTARKTTILSPRIRHPGVTLNPFLNADVDIEQ